MNPFKEQVRRDIDNIIMNTMELAEVHTVDGREMPVVIDNHKLADLKVKSQYARELTQAEVLLFVKPGDLGYLPGRGSPFRLDGEVYRVVEVSGSLLYRIILEANR